MSSFFSRKKWNRVFLYLLFICSTFSIAGTDASITMLFLITFLHWLWDRRLSQLKNPLLWAILFFMASAVFSGLVNAYETDHLMALRTNWRLLLPILLAVILNDVAEDQLLWVFFVFVMLIAIYGIIQYFTGVDWLRPDDQNFTTPYFSGTSLENSVFHGKGNFTHHLTYGGFLLLCFPLLTSLIFCNDWNAFSRLSALAIAILVLLAIGSSLGRSIWLGTAMTGTILFFRLFPKATMAIMVIALAGGTYLYTQFSKPSFEIQTPTNRIEVIQKRFISGLNLKSNQDRLLMWETGIAAIKDHFWLGIGYNNDSVVMPAYRKIAIERTGHRFQNNAGTGVHNIYLQTWLNYGLIGFLGYLSIILIFLAQSIRTLFQTTRFSFENSIVWGSIAGVCGFMVAGFFDNNFRDGEVQAMLLILMGLSLSQRQKLSDRIF